MSDEPWPTAKRPLSENDRYRARYNLATGYANISCFQDMPPLPDARTQEEALRKAEEHCISLINDLLTEHALYTAEEATADGRANRDLVDRLRNPAVILLAGIWAISRNTADYRPSPRWLHLLAIQSQGDDSTLATLLENSDRLTDADLIDWLLSSRLTLVPRSAYNLACYWTAVQRGNEALRDLAVAKADLALGAWAPNDPTLHWLRNNRREEFRRLFPQKEFPPQDSSGLARDADKAETRPATGLRDLPAPAAITDLALDSEFEMQELNRLLRTTGAPPIIASARRLHAPDKKARCRVDIWGYDAPRNRVLFNATVRSPIPWSGQLGVNIRAGGRKSETLDLHLDVAAPGEHTIPRRDVDPYLYIAEPLEIQWQAGESLDVKFVQT